MFDPDTNDFAWTMICIVAGMSLTGIGLLSFGIWRMLAPALTHPDLRDPDYRKR